MHKVLFSFLLFLLHFGDLFGSCLVRGDFKNNDTTLFVHILQYRDGNELTIINKEVKDNLFIYQFPENFEEGIYRVNVITTNHFSFFDIIVLKSEKNIDFEFDNSKPFNLPIFTKSEINKNWFSFIEYALENRKSLLELYDYKKSSQTKNITNDKIDEAVNNHIIEYKTKKNEFISKHNNPWISLMLNSINYSGNEFEIQWENTINEKELMNEITNDNRKLLNTPLLKDYIQTKIVSEISKQKSSKESSKLVVQIYCDLIDKFSINDLVKKCIIRYAIIGFRENKDMDSEKYISNKYSYYM
ncbi:hypothetical protein [Flavobacterium sp.]|uniref:hypothetical protein n=1 Tax=Flavobacterium sp. TaxID=239 RepID=UPI0026107DBF|nr:hypothetical protein [Flavobacterium sp.]